MELEGSAVGVHALEVEDVVDEADEAVGVGAGDAEEVLRLGVNCAEHAGGEKAESAANAGERCAELVRDGGDELVFDGVELFALAQCLLVLEGDLVGVVELLGERLCAALRTEVRDQKCRADG